MQEYQEKYWLKTDVDVRFQGSEENNEKNAGGLCIDIFHSFPGRFQAEHRLLDE